MLDLKHFRQDLSALLSAIEAEVATATTARRVDLGSFLWETITHANKVFDLLKRRHLRPAALSAGGNQPGRQVLAGSGKTKCHVKVPEPRYRLRRDASVDELKRALGPRFDEFFSVTVKVQPKREAGNLVARLQDPVLRSQLLSALEEVQDTPRVFFR